MEWYNYFMSTPTVGIGFNATRVDIPTLERLALSYDDSFRLEHPAMAKWRLDKNGLIISIEQGNISVSRRNNVNVKFVPGKMPEIEYSEIKKYEDNLDIIIKEIISIWDSFYSLGNNMNHSVKRIGIVINAGMTKEELPPGITNLLDKQDQLWGNDLQSYNFKITKCLNEDDKTIELCHHCFNGSYLEKGSTELEFDYQFILKSPKNLTAKQLTSMIDEKKVIALNYFNKFGTEGI